MLPLATFWQMVDENVIHLLSQDGATPAQEDVAFATLSERRRNEVHRRYQYVHAVVKSGPHPFAGPNLKAAIDEAYMIEEAAWREQKRDTPRPCKPSMSTVARWTKRYIESCGSLTALASQTHRRGPKKKRFPIETEALIAKRIHEDYLASPPISAVQLYCNIAGSIVSDPTFSPEGGDEIPSERTIQRRVAEIDPYLSTLKRHGRRRAERLARPAGTRLTASRPMEWVLLDGQRMDVEVIDGDTGESLGRPYLVTLLDVCTRTLAGYFISLLPFCSTTALAAIKDMLTRDPTREPGGRAEKITPDNGRDLVSAAITNLLAKVHIHFEPTEVMDPNGKAILERFYSTVNTQFSHMLHGTTFSSPTARGDYASKDNARYTIEFVREKFRQWVDTIYHKGIHGETHRAPILDWRDRASAFPIPHYSVSDIDAIARVGHRRTISKGRVTVDYLHWKSAALAALEQSGIRDVMVLVDELALAHAYVHPMGKPEKLVLADPVWPDYMVGLTAYEHEKVKKSLQEQEKKDLREIGEYQWELSRWQLYQETHGAAAKAAIRRVKALKRSVCSSGRDDNGSISLNDQAPTVQSEDKAGSEASLPPSGEKIQSVTERRSTFDSYEM
ncbi:integrase catalytic domain-containing protein [Paraburkholderia sp. GAS41]|uniref:integrase catalytic domain-containing protein n=1 Tax=Paraburkholderia sp. GAS41 TaxID=3035134 RepID=UPI003D210B84